jgi:hypothetical protein
MFYDGKFEHVRQSENQSALRDEAGIFTRRNVFLRMFTLVAALSMSAILGVRAFAATIDPKTRRGFYEIASYEVPPEHWQDFLEIYKFVSHRKSVTQRGNVGVFEIRTLLVMK